MKKIIILTCILLTFKQCSCRSFTLLDYESFKEREIEWSNILNFEQPTFIYIYSTYCGHCEQIKQEILSFGNKHINDFYICEYDTKIPLGTDPIFTIEEYDINDVFIVGTPTLIEVKNYLIKENICGANEILNFIHFLE